MYIKRKLNDSLMTFKGLHFGSSYREKSSHRYSVTVGIFGNVGDLKTRVVNSLPSAGTSYA